MEWISNIKDWLEMYPLLCWLAIYLMILFVTIVIGKVIIGSCKFGILFGLALVNATSIVWATWVTSSQPLWITMCIFVFSIVVVIYMVFNTTSRISQEDNKENQSETLGGKG